MKSASLGLKIFGVATVLIMANLAVWTTALVTFYSRPSLLGVALLAYSLGLRHALDADHIAAIDNVTRRLIQGGGRPVGVGLFFSLGHSSIVVLASAVLALTASSFQPRFGVIQSVGGLVGTLISVSFLLVVAVMNILILWTVYMALRRPKSTVDLGGLLTGGGLLARIFRPVFRMIGRSWHMYPLGFLFGLGFDTASEIGLLGISAIQASEGLSTWSIMIFPALFTAAMSLVDTAASILMLGAYGWALVKPLRKLHYNMAVTFGTVVVALLVGGIEALGLLVDRLALKGPLWDLIGAMNNRSGLIGVAIVGIFIAGWTVFAIIYRAHDYDGLDA